MTGTLTVSTLLIVLQFAVATMLPVLACAGLTYLEQHTRFGELPNGQRQFIIGLLFGAIAIFGTERGIYTQDATMNVRDAAPLVAGLYFGGPAGIMAGIIGGVERWFAALWGRGMFTRLACSLATCLVGFYAAILRQSLFDGERPSWSLAFTVGVAAEVLHLLLIFITNLDQTERAFRVAMACTFPMVGCVALSVVLSGVVISLMQGERLQPFWKAQEISQKVRLGMVIVVNFGFIATLAFMSVVQVSLDETNTRNRLMLELEDTERDISDASDDNLLWFAKKAAKEINSVGAATDETIQKIVEDYELTDLYVVDMHGIIVASSDPDSVGFDMSSGPQSAEFLCLIPGNGTTSFVQSYQPMAMDSETWRKFAGVTIKGGFLQVGYDAELFVDDLTDQVRLAVANRHVGRSGQFIVLTERDSLVGARSDLRLTFNDVQKLSGSMQANDEDEVFKVTYQGVPYYAMYRSSEGLRIMAMLPISEVVTQRDLSMLIIAFLEVLVFSALLVAIYVLIRRLVVQNIWHVNEQLGEITAGDLDVEIDVRDSVEFASLSDDINETVGALRLAIEAESARIESDLRTAKAIQSSALPRTFPPFPDIREFDIFARMSPAKEVGGDFYDFFMVDDHTLAFLIADVSGKGIPGALFMMASKAELEHYIKSGMELSEAVRSANWNLCQNNSAGMFVTVWAGKLNYRTGELTFVNAGHNPPLLRHDGSWQWIRERSGLFLGSFETAKYRSSTITLVPGDELLLYTDGVNEAFSAAGEEYGNDRLEAFLAERTDLHPRMIVDTLRSDVRRWAQGTEQSDDVTMLCIEFGTPPDISGQFLVNATKEGFVDLINKAQKELYHLQCPVSVQRQIGRLVTELFASASERVGHESEEYKSVELAYMYDTDPFSLTISLSDWGAPFNPIEEGVTPEMQAAIDRMDDIAYIRDGDMNVVAFRKIW